VPDKICSFPNTRSRQHAEFRSARRAARATFIYICGKLKALREPGEQPTCLFSAPLSLSLYARDMSTQAIYFITKKSKHKKRKWAPMKIKKRRPCHCTHTHPQFLTSSAWRNIKHTQTLAHTLSLPSSEPTNQPSKHSIEHFGRGMFNNPLFIVCAPDK
jgi:hypothetical protein